MNRYLSLIASLFLLLGTPQAFLEAINFDDFFHQEKVYLPEGQIFQENEYVYLVLDDCLLRTSQIFSDKLGTYVVPGFLGEFAIKCPECTQWYNPRTQRKACPHESTLPWS